MPVLGRANGKRGGHFAIDVFNLAAPLAQLGEIAIAQDREEPSAQISAFLEPVEVLLGFQQRFLHKVIGTIKVAAKRDRERA
jgi:hypothetical protein